MEIQVNPSNTGQPSNPDPSTSNTTAVESNHQTETQTQPSQQLQQQLQQQQQQQQQNNRPQTEQTIMDLLSSNEHITTEKYIIAVAKSIDSLSEKLDKQNENYSRQVDALHNRITNLDNHTDALHNRITNLDNHTVNMENQVRLCTEAIRGKDVRREVFQVLHQLSGRMLARELDLLNQDAAATGSSLFISS